MNKLMKELIKIAVCLVAGLGLGLAIDIPNNIFPSMTLSGPFYVLGIIYVFFGLGAKSFKPVGFILKQFLEGIKDLLSGKWLAGIFCLVIAIGGSTLLLMFGWIVGLFFVVKVLIEAAKDVKFTRASDNQPVMKKDDWGTAESDPQPFGLPDNTPVAPSLEVNNGSDSGLAASGSADGWDILDMM